MYMFVHANLLHFVDDIAFVDCWKFVQSKKKKKKKKKKTIQYAHYLLWLNLLSQLCLLKVKGKEVKLAGGFSFCIWQGSAPDHQV